MQRVTFSRTAAAVFTLACCAVAWPAIAAGVDAPLTLHVGEGATVAGGLHVMLVDVEPAGKCPGMHTECVAVTAPQAEVRVEAPTLARIDRVFPLFGTKSPEQSAGTWKLRVVDVAPSPFTEDDVARRRVSVTLFITRNDVPDK